MAILGFPSTSIIDSTKAGRALLTAANASAQRILLGLGTSDSPSFLALVLSGQSLTGSSATSLIDASTTWNTTGVPTAWKLNVIDTASNANSLLMDLQVGGASRFNISKSGITNINGATFTRASADSLIISSSSGYQRVLAYSLWHQNMGAGIGDSGQVGGPEVHLSSGARLGWTSGANLNLATYDLFLARDASGTLAQRNGLNPQALRIYNTYTDASNYERGKFAWSSNILQIGTEKLGTGSVRAMALQTDGTTRLTISASTPTITFGTDGSPPQIFSFSGQSYTSNGNGKGLTLYTSSNSANDFGIALSGEGFTATSGADCVHVLIARTFAPTSGTAAFNFLRVQPVINQTGGANGITRGIFINPTLTAAADYRALETDNNTGYSIYAGGTANSYFNGNIGIKTTSPSQPLEILYNWKYLTNTAPWLTSIRLYGGDSSAVTTSIDGGAVSFASSRWNGTANEAENFVLGTVRTSTGQDGHRFDVVTSTQGGQFSRLTILGDGKVGIGTTSPATLFHISTATAEVDFLSFTASGQTMSLKYMATPNSFVFTSSSGRNINFNNSGNVGVGFDTAPSQKLHVSGNIRVTGAYYDSNNDPGTSGQVLSSTGTGTDWVSLSEITGVDGSGTLNYVAKWTPDGNSIGNSLIFDNGTNVGIGTTSPLEKLHVVGTAKIASGDIVLDNSRGVYFGGSSEYFSGNQTTNSLSLFTNSTNRLFIKSDGNIGIGTIIPASKLDIADTTLSGSGSLAGSILNLAQTWNTTGTPTAIKLNVTDTASNANSLLFNLQVDGANRFRVEKSGVVYAQSTIVSTAGNIQSAASIYTQNSLGVIGWQPGGTWDLMLFRDAANTLAQRNGLNAQIFRVYNTYTDSSNYERGKIAWESNVLRIGTEALGSGAARALELQSNGTTRLQFAANGTTTFNQGIIILSSLHGVIGNVSVAGSGTQTFYDIGTSSYSGTSGSNTMFGARTTFAPTSGTMQFNSFAFTGTVNQTGGANGITRGVYVNPTLTAAADWRSIETTNNTGYAIYAGGTANSYFGGNVGIGSTSPSTLFEVSGTNGSNTIRSTTTSNIGTTAWAGVTAHDVQFYNGDPSGAGIYSAIRVIGSADSGNPYAGTANYDFTIWTGGYLITLSERFRITSLGNVGINTTSPGSTLDVKGTFRLSGSSSGYVGFAPASAAGSTTYTLPSADGINGQVLTTNGAANLSWTTVSGGGGGGSSIKLGTIMALI